MVPAIFIGMKLVVIQSMKGNISFSMKQFEFLFGITVSKAHFVSSI